jgi:hypothetical protein
MKLGSIVFYFREAVKSECFVITRKRLKKPHPPADNEV